MPHLGRGCGRLLLAERRGGEKEEATPPLEQGAQLAKPSGPTWCYKYATSHLALLFSNFLRMHLEHIRKGSDWFGKCLGNSGHGRWNWKPVGKSMTTPDRVHGYGWRAAACQPRTAPGASPSLALPIWRPLAPPSCLTDPLSDWLCKETAFPPPLPPLTFSHCLS